MTDDRRTRRTVLRTAGITASSAVLAGCIDENSTDADPGTSTGNGDGDENSSDAGSDGGSDADDSSAASDGEAGTDGANADSDGETDDGSTDETESDDAAGPDPVETDRAFEIEPGTEVLFRADGLSWVGNRPSTIENVENPTIVLTEGEPYTIGWNGNPHGGYHNIAIYDGTGNVVDDLKTDVTTDPGDDQRLEFTASSEMDEYGCQPHYSAGMAGSIKIRDSDDSSE